MKIPGASVLLLLRCTRGPQTHVTAGLCRHIFVSFSNKHCDCSSMRLYVASAVYAQSRDSDDAAEAGWWGKFSTVHVHVHVAG
jgi:hypothetical protein